MSEKNPTLRQAISAKINALKASGMSSKEAVAEAKKMLIRNGNHNAHQKVQ